MENSEIVKSQAFAVINLLIDQKVQTIAYYIDDLKYRVTPPADGGWKYPFSLTTRVSYERVDRDDNGEHVFNINHDSIERMKWVIQEIERERQMVEELTRFKLKLLNDYDFTKGDNELQQKIFGEMKNDVT